MQVSVENISGLERRLTVQVPGEEIQTKINTKLHELTKTVRISGFRPGRVPMSVIKQRFGKQIRQDILNETIKESLLQAIEDEDLRPASRPRLDTEPEDKEDGGFEFVALLEVYPEIGTLDAAEMSIERPKAEVTDDDVDEMLITLRTQRKTWNPVERTAQEGDQVLMDYSAETKEGRVPEEGTKRFTIVMGESDFDDLEKALASIPGGESKSIKLTFPDDFREPELAGKKAKVELEVVSVSEGVLPEIDEEFIQSFGVEGVEGGDLDLDALKVEIRKNLIRELDQATTNLLKKRLVDELNRISPDLEVPASLITQEASSMVAQMAQGQQIPPEQMQALVEPFKEQAEGRVRAGLLLGELAQQAQIRTNATKVREAIERVASTYEDPAEVVKLYYSNQDLMQTVESSVLEEQVVDWVLENATVNDTEMKFQEVIKAATATK